MVEGTTDLCDVERRVLQEAVVDMERWITDLPAESSWRLAFLASRRELCIAAGIPVAWATDQTNVDNIG